MAASDDSEVLAQISEAIGAMAALFPAAQMGANSIRAYTHMLKDEPLPILIIALDQCSVECKFLPTVAEIREKVAALTQPEHPPALQAWQVVAEAVRRHGSWKPVTAMQEIEAENPLAAEATRCLGFKEICNSENQIADRAHFVKIYDQLVARAQADNRLLPAARQLKELNRGQPLIAQLTGKKD